jgi:hypothetical protein
MKKTPQETLVLAVVGLVLGLLPMAGCQEEQNLSNVDSDAKRSRIIAIENRKLKKKIEAERHKHAREMQKQKRLIDECMRDKKALQKASSEDFQKMMDDLLKSAGQKNIELQQENEELKEQLKRLQTDKGTPDAKLREENDALRKQVKRLQVDKYNLISQITKLRKDKEKLQSAGAAPAP